MSKKKSFSLPMLCAFAWFGHACGSSFATGRLAVQYCTKHGPIGIIGGILIFIMAGAWMYITLEYGRLIKSKNYHDIVSTIYWDNKAVGGVMSVVWDVIQLYSIVITSGACIAGSGSVLQDAFGLNYNIGMILFAAIMVVLFIVGPGVFKRFGKMSFPMFILLMIVCVVSIVIGKERLGLVFAGSTGYTFPEGVGTAKGVANDAFIYACTQLGFVGTGSIFAGQFESRKDTVKAVGVGMLLCGVGLSVCTLATLTTFPACIDQTLPFLEIIKTVKGVGGTVLYAIYVVVLYIAYISTAGSLILSGVSRYGKQVNKIFKNDKITTAVMIIVFLFISTILGKLGLMTIVNKGYGLLGKLRMPTWYLPILILGPISIIRVTKKQKAQEAASAE